MSHTKGDRGRYTDEVSRSRWDQMSHASDEGGGPHDNFPSLGERKRSGSRWDNETNNAMSVVDRKTSNSRFDNNNTVAMNQKPPLEPNHIDEYRNNAIRNDPHQKNYVK